jgi:pimeloyl-ACP methyl ester carboxylesterase
MKSVLRTFPALAVVALLAPVIAFFPAPARAADAPASASPVPASVTQVGSLRVERYGSGSPAMIFIPGLSCGAWEWQSAIDVYGGKHAVYIVTLGGFDGTPEPSGAPLDAADASLLQLITTEKLDRPILVGHSMGGFLALRFGTEHASILRGVVSVDGTPVFPTLLQATPEQRAATADTFAAQIRSLTPEQWAAGQQRTLATMITAPADVDRVAPLSAKSDPKAVADYASALWRADLRPELVNLAVPTLEVAPVPSVPAPFEGPQAASSPMADREAGYKAFYTGLFPGAPHLTVVTIPNSKHFIMMDQPKALYDAITAFVTPLS